MMRTISRGWWLSAALGCAAFAVTAMAADWPQYRGANRDNKITGFTEPATWPKAFTQKWKVSVGDGVASPVLVGDKVYAFARVGEDEVLVCLKASDGSEVWKDKYAADKVTGAAGGFKGPRGTPAVGEGKICTLGVGGVVSCLEADTGKLVWRKETKSRPKFSTSTSPVIEKELCIVHVGTDGRGDLTAYELKSGDVKWKVTGDGPSYGSPVIATIHGVRQVVELTDKSLMGVSLEGKQLWKVAHPTGRYQTGTPVIDGDTVICSGTAFTITKDGDTFGTKQAWKGTMPHNYNSPVLKDGLLYGLTGQGRNTSIFCVDAKTGKTLWTDTARRGECGAILDGGSVLLALTSDSNLVAFKPSNSEYKEVASIKVADSPTWAYPIIDGKRVFVKDRDSVISWTME